MFKFILPILIICSSSVSSNVDKRARVESKSLKTRFVITPHRQNYVMPITYGEKPTQNVTGTDKTYEEKEIKFQISMKYKIFDGIFSEDFSIFLAYTHISWWQAYNKDISAPFRETNYEPEVFAMWKREWSLGNIKGRVFSFGFNHQSNGQQQPVSKSWNRIFAASVFEIDKITVKLKGWYRVPEEKKESILDPQGDDNPDLEEYVGYFDLILAHRYNRHIYSAVIRNNLRGTDDNKGAITVDWSFPLGKNLNGYVQYFNGFGENLVEYKRFNQRAGFGISMSDWL